MSGGLLMEYCYFVLFMAEISKNGFAYQTNVSLECTHFNIFINFKDTSDKKNEYLVNGS